MNGKARKRPPTRRAAAVSDEAVRARTGCGWKEWFYVLDRAGARSLPHREIAALIARRWPKVGGWWSQMITVAYERARGLRQLYQTAEGFRVSSSRTLPVSVSALYRAWASPRARASWLPEKITVRKKTAPRIMRITWKDGKSDVQVHFLAKGPRKSVVAIEHGRLASVREVASKRAYWKKALGRLEAKLAG